MKRILVVSALFIAIPALAATIQPCVPDTAANYIAQGSCTEDPFILKNFDWNGNFGTVQVPPDQVLLVPTGAPGQFGLNFQGAGNTNPFTVSGNQTIQALFAYTIDPRPPIINGATLTLTPTSTSAAGTRPGTFAPVSIPFAKITATICAGDTFADHCRNGIEPPITLVVDTRTNLQDSIDFPTGVNVLDILMNLDMEANGGSISIIGGGVSAQAAIPEPASAALALSGFGALLAFSYYRRRRA